MLINFANQPAYILHTRAYRDTSLLLEVYAKELGRITVLARGVKRAKRPLTGLLQPFIPLALSAKGRGEIVTMTHVEPLQQPLKLAGNRQVAGLYVNELMMRLVGKFEGSIALFDHYQNTLMQLQGGNIEIPLRCFERRLIEELGYGLTFNITLPDLQPVVAEHHYVFTLNQGFTLTSKNLGEMNFPGKILLKIAAEEYDCQETLHHAKKLFRYVLQSYLGKKPLMTRQLWQKEEV